MNEIYKDIQGILAVSDIHPADCIKINNLIVELIKENEELKSQLKGTTHCFDEEEHEKLKKQLEEYKRLGFKYLQDKNNNLEKQQKEFIKYMNSCIKELEKGSPNKLQNTINLGIIDITKTILQKYKSVIGDIDDKK